MVRRRRGFAALNAKATEQVRLATFTHQQHMPLTRPACWVSLWDQPGAEQGSPAPAEQHAAFINLQEDEGQPAEKIEAVESRLVSTMLFLEAPWLQPCQHSNCNR
jgi:hypothetical protein